MGSHDAEVYMILSRIAMAGDGIVLGLGMAALAAQTWLKFRGHSKALELVKASPELSVHDLRSLIELEESPASSSVSSSSSSRTFVMVRGRIDTEDASKEVLTPVNSGDKAVFIEKSQTYLYNEWRGIFGWRYEWRSLFRWGTLGEQASASIRKVPFVLRDNGENATDFIHVDMDHIPPHLPLVTVHHKLYPVHSTTTFLQAVFGRRYPVGLIEQEKILPVGKIVTAMGLLDKRVDGQPSVRSLSLMPFFLTEYTKDQLIVEIDTSTQALYWAGIIFSSIAVGVLGYAFYKNWRKWKEWRRMKRMLAELEASRRQTREDEPPEDTSDVPDGELCVVCLLRRRRAAFVPCGHRVCCMTCANHILINSNARCPVCREDVSQFIRIYDP